MSMLKLSFAALALAVLSVTVRAEDAKPDAPKPDDTKTAPAETKPADAKPADAAAADKPLKTPDGLSPVNNVQSESLVGEVTKGLTGENGKEMKAKKAAKKGLNADSIILHVANHGDAEVKKGKGKGGREVNLTGDADMLAKLTAFAEKKANIKVTGALTGDTMTVKEVSEAPAEPAAKKKKKNSV
jgi:hypothetical protein